MRKFVVPMSRAHYSYHQIQKLKYDIYLFGAVSFILSFALWAPWAKLPEAGKGTEGLGGVQVGGSQYQMVAETAQRLLEEKPKEVHL